MGTEESDAQVARVADGINYVCDHLADIRASLEYDGGDATALDRLLAALKTGAATARLLDDLDAAVQASGDQVGVYGYVRAGAERGSVTGASMPGIGPPQPAELVYLCPGRLCSRFWWPGASAAIPVCALNGQPLSAERL
jgi:hypothetical protein